MKKAIFALIVLAAAMAAETTYAQSQKEKDRAAFISNAKLLERKPFDPNADAARQRGFKWIADTDEVTVKLCSESMKLIPEKKNKFKSELLMQFTFGVAVFKLENPDKKDDEVSATEAGLASVLRTYEVMLAENPKAKNADLDALLVKRGSGELRAVAESSSCKEDK